MYVVTTDTVNPLIAEEAVEAKAKAKAKAKLLNGFGSGRNIVRNPKRHRKYDKMKNLESNLSVDRSEFESGGDLGSGGAGG
ncbi:hypothetical protein BTUL_0041g00070 [Botrytis tulipae]|uniref:Uncharacterized protein n=1 Tax=Botrytis tulipae TaxID=87230 RepID=A0A4Z1EXY5_9HELO|nr:hypothetical protein BTUL_0041g00070 [Botrytis tulipae]